MDTFKISTIAQAVTVIGWKTQHGVVSSCGIHRDGRTWVGIGHCKNNDDGSEMVAPLRVHFLPVTLTVTRDPEPGEPCSPHGNGG